MKNAIILGTADGDEIVQIGASSVVISAGSTAAQLQPILDALQGVITAGPITTPDGMVKPFLVQTVQDVTVGDLIIPATGVFEKVPPAAP